MPFAAVLAFFVLACAGSTIAAGRQERPCSAVPATPPDSIPREYETMADTISAAGRLSSPVLRDIVLLQFRRGTSRADKIAAVCLVDGVVVGGRPLMPGEGIYLVRIPGDRTAQTLFKAIDSLRQLPQVLYAGPEAVLRLRGASTL